MRTSAVRQKLYAVTDIAGHCGSSATGFSSSSHLRLHTPCGSCAERTRREVLGRCEKRMALSSYMAWPMPIVNGARGTASALAIALRSVSRVRLLRKLAHTSWGSSERLNVNWSSRAPFKASTCRTSCSS